MVLLAGCGGRGGGASAVCYDPDSLSVSQRQKRELLKYVDTSADAQKICSGCENYSADSSVEACGACSSLGGPVEPGGHCTAWRAAA